MNLCKECGATIPEGVRFCTSCGAPVKSQEGSASETEQRQSGRASDQLTAASTPSATATQSPPSQQMAQQMPQQNSQQMSNYSAQQTYHSPAATPAVQQPSYPPSAFPAQPVYAGDMQPPRGSRFEAMSTGAYFWTMFLFSLPLIGFVACLAMSFMAKNVNRRNFAKAVLIFMIIGLIFSVILYFAFSWMIAAATEYLESAVKESSGGASGLQDLLNMLKGLQAPATP